MCAARTLQVISLRMETLLAGQRSTQCQHWLGLRCMRLFDVGTGSGGFKRSCECFTCCKILQMLLLLGTAAPDCLSLSARICQDPLAWQKMCVLLGC